MRSPPSECWSGQGGLGACTHLSGSVRGQEGHCSDVHLLHTNERFVPFIRDVLPRQRQSNSKSTLLTCTYINPSQAHLLRNNTFHGGRASFAQNSRSYSGIAQTHATRLCGYWLTWCRRTESLSFISKAILDTISLMTLLITCN